jgi:hypothetical protein
MTPQGSSSPKKALLKAFDDLLRLTRSAWWRYSAIITSSSSGRRGLVLLSETTFSESPVLWCVRFLRSWYLEMHRQENRTDAGRRTMR